MNTFEQKLESLLRKDIRFLDQEGDILKSEVIDKARKIDEKLIELLLDDNSIKEKFFSKIKGYRIFNTVSFVDYIQDKNFLNNSYTKYRNKIGLTVDGKFLNQRNEVALVRPYKDCVLEGGQSEEEHKRKEIFFNEILAQDEIDRLLEPKVLTSYKRYSTEETPSKSVFSRNEEGIIDDNLIIKGNNLIALHTLKKQFLNKVKLIYIDPPYNTGNEGDTFAYNNTFKHSTWLTFIKNRLEIAKELLKDDGFVAITIDHVELFYLGMVADEVFGRENRVGLVSIVINPKGRQHARFFSAVSEYMLVYAKNITNAQFNKVAIDNAVAETFTLNDGDDTSNYRLEPFIRARTGTLRKNKPKFWYSVFVSKDLKDISLDKKQGYYEVLPIKNGKEFTWKIIPQSFEKKPKGYFIAQKEGDDIVILHKYHEQQVIKNVWTDKRYHSEFNGTNLLKKILGANTFSYPKSLYAVMDTIKLMTSGDDIILDFFGGSGTTAHAVLEQNKEDGENRKFIITEQMDYINTVTVPRVEKIIEGEDSSFVYIELKKYNEQFIQDIQNAKTQNDILKIWEHMKKNSFLNWNIDFREQEEAMLEFKQLSIEQQKQALCSLLDKNYLYVNYDDIEDKDFDCSKQEKDVSKSFYGF